MNKNDLIAALRAIDGNPEVFVSGVAVEGVEVVQGRINREGYGGATFALMPNKPRDAVITFTRGDELSTGEWVQRPI